MAIYSLLPGTHYQCPIELNRQYWFEFPEVFHISIASIAEHFAVHASTRNQYQPFDLDPNYSTLNKCSTAGLNILSLKQNESQRIINKIHLNESEMFQYLCG